MDLHLNTGQKRTANERHFGEVKNIVLPISHQTNLENTQTRF